MKTRSGRAKKPPALMLTSLLDMFTIILIFLIVSFDAEDYDFKLNPDLSLPESSAQSVFKPAVNMAITLGKISIERKTLGDEKDTRIFSYPLNNGKATPEDYEAGQIDPVVKVLEEIYQRNIEAMKEARAEEEDVNADDPGAGAEDTVPTDDEEEAGTIIMLQGDKTLNYKTLYLVMRSARIAGFSKYRLAIMKR